jgi:2-amino-4-hydroxy-6-hydroxymethyldihydropteridine diphosphokinase
MCPKTLISLGSNQNSVWGDVSENVKKAVEIASKISLSTPSCSQFYATPAFPEGTGPDFVNAVIAIETDMSPQQMLDALHLIEAQADRQRVIRWGQRTLDLDLIAMGQHVCPSSEIYDQWRNLPLADQVKQAPDQLILPHPRMQDRAFVLVPLCDVAPDWVHPVLGHSARALCDALPAADRASVVPLAS